MFDCTENFILQVRSAMREYENSFSENKPMPEHRALDVVNLRIVLEKPYRDLDSCLDIVKQQVSKFKTGWWIFKTGRSRLKDNILFVVHSYENPITQGLVRQISKMNQSLSQLEIELDTVRDRTECDANILDRPTSDDDSDIEPVKSSIFSFSLEEKEETTWFKMRK